MIFFIHFIVDRYTKLKLGMKYIMADFSGKSRKIKNVAKEETGKDSEALEQQEKQDVKGKEEIK